MSQIGNLLGTPVPFEFEGRRYPVAPRTIETEGLFETWLESRDLDAIERHAPDFNRPGGPGRLSPAAYQMQLAGHRRDCVTGLFDWDGPVCTLTLVSDRGQKELAHLQLLQTNPGLDRRLFDRIWKDPDARARLQAIRNQVDSDPNPTAPAGEGSPSA